MMSLQYASIFERYYWGKRCRAIRWELTPNSINIRALASAEETTPVNWLDGNPSLVLRLKASPLGSVVWLGSLLQEHKEWFEKLPSSYLDIKTGDLHLAIKRFCQDVYGAQALVHVLPDINFYCARSMLKMLTSECLRRVTAGNVHELTAWLVREGQLYEDDPSYILDNGPAFAWFEGGKPVGFASVHPSELQDRVGNIGNVFVDKAYRGRGIAKAVVSSVAEGLLDVDRMPVYGCSADNHASAGVAAGAGFKFAGCSYRVYVAQ